MAVATLQKAVSHARRLCVAQGSPDGDLLELYTREANESAFTEIVQRHGPMVFAVCKRVLQHQHDAEDAWQATFIVLARKADSIRQHDSLAGWLHQVAQRISLRARGMAERRRHNPLPADLSVEQPRANLLSMMLDEELAHLPEQFRTALVLCYLEGRTQAEAARLLSTTADAVNSRLKRAREMLRDRLTRRGMILSATALAAALTASAAQAGTIPAFVADSVSAHVAEMVEEAIRAMSPVSTKLFAAVIAGIVAIAFAVWWLPGSAQGNVDPPQAEEPVLVQVDKPKDKAPLPRRCIILWMSGGPSQLDTFDPKPGAVALFNPIDTSVKGMQFTEVLPKLARYADHLAVLRSVTHREGDHGRSTHLMHTGQAPGGAVQFPGIGSVLAKELGDKVLDVPRFVAIDSAPPGPGFLGNSYAPLRAGSKAPFGIAPDDPEIPLPTEEEFTNIDKDKGAAWRKAITESFDLTKEKDAMRAAYGKGRFGQACLLARRLSERGVPVVEVTLGGWDTHGDAVEKTKTVAGRLDAAFTTLVKDLHERKLLDQTLIVWMGEFGRTPKVNASMGRDHYPMAFTCVLAGAGIKGGQAIGKTSDDGAKVAECAISPQELHATIYRALNIDPQKTNTVDGRLLPLVERGNDPVKEALR
jgi:RNA polymerase sigma factor (sigma-70 family)